MKPGLTELSKLTETEKTMILSYSAVSYSCCPVWLCVHAFVLCRYADCTTTLSTTSQHRHRCRHHLWTIRVTPVL